MDACHILLGRPWLFDNHAMHDGHANMYALKFKGRSLTWVERAINKSEPLFALHMVESNTIKKAKPLHPHAQSLLREFEDVFLNYLPSELPLL